MAVRDYSTTGNKDTVEMIVRPGLKFGESIGGETVRIDRKELKVQPVAETLCSAKEYRAAVKAAKETADAPIPDRPSDAIGKTIASQIEAATADAVRRRRGDRRFDPVPDPSGE